MSETSVRALGEIRPLQAGVRRSSQMRLRLYHHYDGARVAYRETGTGPALVLLHSLGLSHREYEPIVEPLGHKVYTVVNYDGFELDREVEDEYLDTVKELGDRYFHGVTRFATSAFMRAKLGDALGKRGVAAHIYESEDEAKGVVRETNPRT